MKTITQTQWNKINDDYKSIIENQHYILKLTDKGTAFIPVDVIRAVLPVGE